MLNKVPASMITPKVVIDVDPASGGLLIKYGDGSTKSVAISGSGGTPPPPPPGPNPVITINGGTTTNVLPNANLAVRVRNVPSGTVITWAGTGASIADPIIATLNSQVGTSTGTDFTASVSVGAAERSITFTASVGGNVVGTFTATVAAAAVDFQLADMPALTFSTGSTTPQQVTVSLTGITGDIGNVAVSISGGSAPLTVQPTSLALTSSQTSGNFNVTLGSSAVAGQTHTITVTAVSGAVTRTKTVTVNVQAGAVQYSSPVLTVLTEPGLPANEISLGAGLGFRVENVYTGAGASLILKGWNTSASVPNGVDLDITPLLSDPQFYNSSTKVFNFPTSGLKPTLSTIENLSMFSTSSGVRDRSISSGVLPFSVAHTAPDNQTRTSNTVNVTVRRPAWFTSSLNSTKEYLELTGGQSGSLNFNFYAPKYAGKNIGFYWSVSLYGVPFDLGPLNSSGFLAYSFAYGADFADASYTTMGAYSIAKFFAFSGSVKERAFGEIALSSNPNGAAGGADVPPPVTFRQRNTSLPIDLQFKTSSGSPAYSVASSGTFSGNSFLRRDLNLVVSRSALGSSFRISISNLHIASTTGQTPSYSISGVGLTLLDNTNFNELTTTGNAPPQSSTEIYYGNQRQLYNNSDIEIVLPMSVVNEIFNRDFTATRVGLNFNIGAFDPAGGLFYALTTVAIVITQ